MKKWLYKRWCVLTGKCPDCGGQLIHRDTGETCKDCGWNEYVN